jgi:hypothetical protein
MTLARTVSCSCLLTLGFLTSAFAEDSQDGFHPLFNGKNLDGWVPVNTAKSTWSVKDGMIVCTGKPIGEMRTETMYQNFILEVEWRHLKPKGNAGIFIWADDITAPGVPFHRGIEVQVLENAYGNTKSHTTHGDIFPIHGAKMTPINGRGGSRAFPTESRSKPSPEWNHYRIVCQDGEISLAVNGKVVTRGKDCSPRKGYICLESEGGVVHYRNMKIKELPATPIEVKDIAIANRGYRSLYSGVDLSGWKVAKDNAEHWKSNDWVLSFDGKSKSKDKSLTLTEPARYSAIVFDIRLKGTSGVTRVFVNPAQANAILIDPADKQLAKYLNPVGRWNRFEGTVSLRSISMRLNGHELPRMQFPILAGGRLLKIVPEGPVDFSNIYVRDLKVAK